MDASALTYKAPQSVYASRPGSPSTGQIWIMTDTDCSGTTSATPTQCRWSGSTWQATGGTSGGSSTTNPLQTLSNLVTRTSSTVLTLLPNAGASTPYGFTVYSGTSDTTYNFTTSPTVTITGGSGSDTAYIYVDIGGTLTVGNNNLTMSCSGACTVVSGITQFPKSSIHIATWTASSATWDASGGTNFLGVGSSINTASIGPGGSSCTSGTVAYSDLTAAATTQEITVISGVPALTGYVNSYLNQATNFSGGSATGLTVSMGRTGSPNNYEMTGFPVSLMSGGITIFPFTPSGPLQTSSTYNIVLAFTSTGANLNTFTAGSLVWEVCSLAF